MITINGKSYPLWSQFVERKQEWIGGTLEDFGDSMDAAMGLLGEDRQTEITDITLTPNGKTGAAFTIEGKDFGCGGDVSCMGVTAGEEGWLTFAGYGGHTFRIKATASKGAA
jgi:hypothetical protein